MLDDDKNFDKNVTRLMIGGALLTNALAFAVGYDTGYQSGAKRLPEPITVHGNLTINNNSNNFNSSQPTALDK
jgi:hypothetical protein